VRISLVGTGAIAEQHLMALASIEDVQVLSVVGKDQMQAQALANRYGILRKHDQMSDVLGRHDIDAVILCTPTPTPMHAAQALECLEAGKHVLVEIPLADALADARAVVSCQQRTGLVAMCAHTRRFNPGHRWVQERIGQGAFTLRHLNARTSFLRRSNMNAQGQTRDWVDHLLWHHAAHTIDLFQYQTGEQVCSAHVVQGPIHVELGIALDMAVQLQTPSGAICSLSLSFNNRGPHGSNFRYIGDGETYLVRYDDLTDGDGNGIQLPRDFPDGITAQDREFVAAIREQREPVASVASVMPCYELLDDLEQQLKAAS
jgi:2-hydroxy-4-carboxymuconate semialdehyde hemiacetal dehydrogenase